MTQTRIYQVSPAEPDRDVVGMAAAVLRAGGLVAFPTETVYGLGANALMAEAVARIFAAKERPASDPIIVHLADADQLQVVAVDIPPLAYSLAAAFWPGPLTLVMRRAAAVPANVSGGRDTVAVRIPAHPVAQALLAEASVPVAAPSANRFARPSATLAAHVLEDLGGRVDIILDAGPTPIGLESTVVDLTQSPPAVLRPGGLSLERLRELVPDVQVIERYLQPQDAGIEAPGMLLKHYSPRAELRLFDGSPPAVRQRMRQEVERLQQAGMCVGVLCPDDETPIFRELGAHIGSIGPRDNLEEVARRLFLAMRALDAAGVDVILAHSLERSGLGAAIWDRLLRAAEGRVTIC